jgi:hypothetical protein
MKEMLHDFVQKLMTKSVKKQFNKLEGMAQHLFLFDDIPQSDFTLRVTDGQNVTFWHPTNRRNVIIVSVQLEQVIYLS